MVSTTDVSMPAPSSWPEPSDEAIERGPARVIAVLRVLVVASMSLLVAFGTSVHRTYLVPVALLLALAALYSLTVLLMEFRGRGARQSWVTGIDTLITLGVIAGSGGADSRTVAVLPLAIVATAVRQGLRTSVLAALVASVGYGLAVGLVPGPDVSHQVRFEAAVWWGAYLFAFAVLAGTLRQLLDREHESVVDARAEARADHLAYAEERDLRERLAQSQQALDDGIRVLLHEFRTPVSSLHTLAQLLQDEASGEQALAQRCKAVGLVAAHARHLTQMLDQVAGLAITSGDPLGTSRLREVTLEELAWSAADAAGVGGVVDVVTEGHRVRCDEQGVRRILTNLLENAVKHGGVGKTVGLHLVLHDRQLRAEVLDRGPGLPPGQEHLVTKKYVSIGEREGTTGLGLWIVEQLVTGLGGTLVLAAREGGGLVARVTLPVPS